jgi:hypothetical protein
MGGYSGARLAPLFSPTPSRITSRRMAEHGAEHWRRRVAELTPVDESEFPSRAPGTARRSWRVLPVLRFPSLSAEVYETGIESWDHVTVLLEYGTGIHGPHRRPFVIEGKRGGLLHFYSRRLGRWVFARSVVNPGQVARRPLASGAALTEVELAAVLQADLEEWVRLVEAIGRAQPRG